MGKGVENALMKKKTSHTFYLIKKKGVEDLKLLNYTYSCYNNLCPPRSTIYNYNLYLVDG